MCFKRIKFPCYIITMLCVLLVSIICMWTAFDAKFELKAETQVLDELIKNWQLGFIIDIKVTQNA